MIDLNQVRHVLDVIADPSQLRAERGEDDLEGDFTRWFDGGAVKSLVGWTEYHFEDGTLAVVTGRLKLRLSIRFPNGRFVTLDQTAVPPMSEAFIFALSQEALVPAGRISAEVLLEQE
jgi:hypothetical protein